MNDLEVRQEENHRATPPGGALAAIFGTWLFLSAFCWPHTGFQRVNTLLVGLLTVALAVSARGTWSLIWARIVPVLGAWLIVSSIVFWHTEAWTAWNNTAIGAFLVLTGVATWGARSEHSPLRRRATV